MRSWILKALNFDLVQDFNHSIMRHVYLSFFLLLFIAACSDDAIGPVSDNTGEPAPNFNLTSLDGEQVRLSDHQGKVVYLFFYGADCPHCRSNGPVTETQIHQTFKNDTNFVALGLDTWNLPQSANNSFRSATGITYPLLLSARSVLVDYYGNSNAYDRSVVVDAEGNIAYQGSGYVNTDADQVKEIIESELSEL